MTYWQVPEIWLGETAVLLGGGPSLTRDQIDAVHLRKFGVRGTPLRVIAINNAYRVAPWADLLYFCEEKFWRWNRGLAEWKSFPGLKVALETAACFAAEPEIKRLRNYGPSPGLEDARDGLRHGWSSGYAAIGLAALLGARRIVLLGYDMKATADGRTHWHKDYPIWDPPSVYADRMLAGFASLVVPLRRRGVTVLNATPGSAIECFPRVPLESAFAWAPPSDGHRAPFQPQFVEAAK